MRKRYPFDHDPVYMHCACPAFNFFALPGQVAELFSIDLERRIHRRHLRVFALKRGGCLPDPAFRAVYGTGFQNRPCCILCIRADTQKHVGAVDLVCICQKAAYLCGASEADRKNADRGRIKRSGMADLLLAENMPQLCYHIVARKAFFLVNVQYSGNQSIPSQDSCRAICLSSFSVTSSSVPVNVHPAALTWPPPPKWEAIFAPSTGSPVRRLILHSEGLVS